MAGLRIVFTPLLIAVLGTGIVRSQSLIFDEEFQTLNLSRWQHEITLGGGGNWEFELYSNNRTNSYVRDGVLYIQPTFLADDIGDANVKSGYMMDLWGSVPGDYCTSNKFYGCTRTSGVGGNYLNPIKSAKLRTVQSFSFKYGRVEIRAKLPRGDWLWPAFWLLPRENQYGDWPASGEIDIMESRGNPPSYQPGGYDTFGSTLHWGPAWNEDMWSKTHAEKKGVDLTADFHTYGLVWNSTYIGIYLSRFARQQSPGFQHIRVVLDAGRLAIPSVDKSMGQRKEQRTVRSRVFHHHQSCRGWNERLFPRRVREALVGQRPARRQRVLGLGDSVELDVDSATRRRVCQSLE